MAVFTRILKNLGAMVTGRAVTIIQQLVITPVFIGRYSTALFGEWVCSREPSAPWACSILAFRRI